MGILYYIVAALVGFIIAKIIVPSSNIKKIVISIFLPILINFIISLTCAIFMTNSMGYGYNTGTVLGMLLPSTLVMMIVLGLCIKVSKKHE